MGKKISKEAKGMQVYLEKSKTNLLNAIAFNNKKPKIKTK